MRPRGLQRRGPAGRLAAPRRVHDLVGAGEAEVQETGLRAAEIEMVRRKLRRYPRAVEVRAPPASKRIEAIRERGAAAGQGGEPPAVDPERLAPAEQKASIVVVADHAHRLDRQAGIQAFQIDCHVAAGTAVLTVELDDVGHRVFDRPGGNRLVEVDAPGSRAQDAATPIHYAFLSAELQHGFGDLVVAIQRLSHRDRMRASFSSSLNMQSSMPARGGGAPYSAADAAGNSFPARSQRSRGWHNGEKIPWVTGSQQGIFPQSATPL